jgi:hypothetical protein
LTLLAKEPDNSDRGVRLLRRIEADYEFVHDQMNAFLAARWFAGQERSVADMQGMISGSKIWKDTKDAQRALWGFAAAMLNAADLQTLWSNIRDDEVSDTLRRALASAADDQGLNLKVTRGSSRRMPT